jgi:hypothetical protein
LKTFDRFKDECTSHLLYDEIRAAKDLRNEIHEEIDPVLFDENVLHVDDERVVHLQQYKFLY